MCHDIGCANFVRLKLFYKWMWLCKCGSMRGMECTSNEVTSMSFTINEGLGVILDDGLVHDLVNSGAFSGQGACSRPGRPCWGPALPLQVLHVVLLHSKNAKDKVWHAWCKLTVTSGKIQSKEKTKNRQIREKGPSWCDALYSTEMKWNLRKEKNTLIFFCLYSGMRRRVEYS